MEPVQQGSAWRAQGLSGRPLCAGWGIGAAQGSAPARWSEPRPACESDPEPANQISSGAAGLVGESRWHWMRQRVCAGSPQARQQVGFGTPAALWCAPASRRHPTQISEHTPSANFCFSSLTHRRSTIIGLSKTSSHKLFKAFRIIGIQQLVAEWRDPPPPPPSRG